jgi:hypothetical protein
MKKRALCCLQQRHCLHYSLQYHSTHTFEQTIRQAQPESKLDQNDFIAKAKALFYALRHGQTEKVLAFFVFALPTAAAFFRQQEWTGFHQAANLAFALSAVSVLWLVVRIWKRATPPPEPPAGPVPSAIKGLFPFTAADGKLFAQLGRQMELQQLLGLARNDRVAISAVRGESGAGKTSLLQAGLAYTLGEQQCIYWEAVPENAPDALLHAIRSQLPEIESLESLPQACPRRCVLILDQFEQLRTEEPGHAPVFALLTRIAKASAPYKLSAMIGFRREYAADWLDFEKDLGFRAEQVPINLLAPLTAGDALVTLASEAGFTLDQALVENFITSVARAQGILPVDIAIGVLSLANFVQQRGVTHVGMKEYSLAGGAQGLLLSFVQQKLEEIPEDVRAPLLKGVVLALVSPSNNQRVAAGETIVVIASKAEVPESTLLPWLERLAHPRVRLLEKLGKKAEALSYRLPHERLVPVLRRLAGATLASLDQLRLRFEGEYVRWRETGDRRNLIAGKDLRTILRHSAQFVQGETAAAKAQYLAACQRRRAIIRAAAAVAILAMAGAGYAAYRAVDSSIQQAKLKSWGLPPELFKAQHDVDEISLLQPVNDLVWLRSTRLKQLEFDFNGSSLAGLEKLRGLTSLDLRSYRITNLAELEKLQGLNSLTLHLRDSQIASLGGLENLRGLNSLTLDLRSSRITSLAGLEKLQGLNSLTLDLRSSRITSLAGLEKLQGLKSLTLDLLSSRVTSLAELEKLQGLNSLTLHLSYSRITSLAGLEKLKGLKSLTLDLLSSRVTSLAGLEKLQGLSTLTLELHGSNIKGLTELEKLQGLNSLTLHLGDSQITSFAGLEKLPGLKSLTLDLVGSRITSLAELEKLPGLRSLMLDLRYSRITSLTDAELAKLQRLTSLTLDLRSSQITSLVELEGLQGLASIKMALPAALVSSFSRSNIRRDITSLWILIDASTPFEVPPGCKFVGIVPDDFEESHGFLKLLR